MLTVVQAIRSVPIRGQGRYRRTTSARSTVHSTAPCSARDLSARAGCGGEPWGPRDISFAESAH